MINDVSILRLKPWDQNSGDIPRMDPINESEYKEFWSFWGIEKAYQIINGRKRLRYHLGHVLFAQQLRDLNNRSNYVKPVLLDYRGGGKTRANWSDDDLRITESFLNIFLGDTVVSERIQYYVDKVKHSSMKPFYDKIKSQTYNLTKPIRVAYENFKKNEHTLYYLQKYRDLSVGDLQYVPPCLNDFYEKSGVKDIVPSHVFFASVFALYMSDQSQSDFVNGFWVKEGFPLLACIREVEGRKICIIEGKRSAYVWLFIDYLRIMYDHKNNCKLDLPDVGYLDSLPSLHGAPFMQRDVPEEALFIDSFSTEMKKKMLHMSKVLRGEYSLRVFGQTYNPEQDPAKWRKVAVGECECIRNKIDGLRGHYKRNETVHALVECMKKLCKSFSAVIDLIFRLWTIHAK